MKAICILVLLLSIGCVEGEKAASDSARTISSPSMSVSGSLYAVETIAHSLTLQVSGSITYECISGCISGMSLNSSTGAFTWTPTTGAAGDYPMTIRAHNEVGYSDHSVTVNVTPNVWHVPTMTAIPNQTISVGQTLTLTPEVHDQDGHPVTVSVSGGPPANATFQNGVFTFTPAANQVGTISVVFFLTNGQLSGGGSVQITVQ